MATLRVKTKIAGVLADVAEVRLSDPGGTFGVRTGESGAILVADGTAMTRVSAGTYEYDVAFPASDEGVAYTWWQEVGYGGELYHVKRVYYQPPTAAAVVLTRLDEILLSDWLVLAAERGESVTVTPPGGTARSVTGIVTRATDAIRNNPRGQTQPATISLRNSDTLGISAAEWNSRFEVRLRRKAGDTAMVDMRTLKPIHSNGAYIVWELTG